MNRNVNQIKNKCLFELSKLAVSFNVSLTVYFFSQSQPVLPINLQKAVLSFHVQPMLFFNSDIETFEISKDSLLIFTIVVYQIFELSESTLQIH